MIRIGGFESLYGHCIGYADPWSEDESDTSFGRGGGEVEVGTSMAKYKYVYGLVTIGLEL